MAPISMLKSQAAWMIASRGGRPIVHDEGEAMSPAIDVAPHSPSFAAETPDRAKPKTICPRATSSRTTAEPIEPVPPSTRTRMIVCFVEACPLNEHPEKSKRLGRILRCNDATQNCLKSNPNEEISSQIDLCRTPHRSACFSAA